jgi:hypothetical protein
MKHNVTLLEDDDFDLDDDVAPEYDFSQMTIDVERTQRFRAQARANTIRLAPDVAEAFPTSEAVNEALRQILREKKAA